MDKNNNSKEVAKKQPKKKSRIGSFFKEAFSELKKVSWPTFATVIKTTLVVLAVVVIFLVVLFAFDTLLGLGHDALLSNAGGETTSRIIAATNKIIGAIGI